MMQYRFDDKEQRMVYEYVDESRQRETVLPVIETLAAIKDLTGEAFKLLILYYSKTTGDVIDDKEIAEALEVTEKRVKELRKELVDKDYLLIEKGGHIDNYFIGRQAVMAWKNPDAKTAEVDSLNEIEQ